MLELIPQLARDEGLINHAYQDSLGFWTIGYGRLIDERKGGGLSTEECGMLLLNDIKKHTDAVRAVLPWTVTLSSARFGVLANMHFQLGNNLFSFVNTIQLIKEAKYDMASVAMLQSKWATQTPLRAKRMADQMRLDRWQ